MQTIDVGEAVKVVHALATTYQMGGAAGGDLDRKLDGFVDQVLEVLQVPNVTPSDYLSSLTSKLSLYLHTLEIPEERLPDKHAEASSRARIEFFRAAIERLDALKAEG